MNEVQQPVSQPTTPAQQPVQESAPVKNSMNMMLIIPLFLVAVAIVVTAYWFMSGSKTNDSANGAPVAPGAQQASTSSGLENDLNAIDVESNDSDFSDVDNDLKSL